MATCIAPQIRTVRLYSSQRNKVTKKFQASDLFALVLIFLFPPFFISMEVYYSYFISMEVYYSYICIQFVSQMAINAHNTKGNDVPLSPKTPKLQGQM